MPNLCDIIYLMSLMKNINTIQRNPFRLIKKLIFHLFGSNGTEKFDSAQKANEIEMEKKNIELAKANTELTRINLELQRLGKMKTNFLSIASHELRTPLTAIRGYTDIIVDNMQNKMEPSVYKMMQTVSRATNRLHHTVNNIVIVSRIHENRMKLSIEKTDLKELLKECIEEAEVFASKRNIRISINLPEYFPHIYIDKNRLHQAFINLIINAIKFSPDGKEITTTATHEKDFVHIIFSDQGIGIDKEEQNKIFDPFYEVSDVRQHSSGNNKFLGRGAGLGLTIVRGIIELHGGNIRVKSECMDMDKCPGSNFHIFLPVHPHRLTSTPVEQTHPVKKEKLPRKKSAAESDNGKRTLLIIDSSGTDITGETRKMLEKIFSIQTAKNGGDGIQKAFEFNPSIILIEAGLQGISGIEICRVLKNLSKTARIPIAIFSRDTRKLIIEEAYYAGAEEFIVAPFDSKELADKIWQLLIARKALLKEASQNPYIKAF